MKGIDVSHYQGNIDFDKVKADGIEFCMIKATEGQNFVDPKFKENAEKCTVHKGAYHFLRATTVDDARKEARFFLDTIKPYRFDFPLAIDAEAPELAALGKQKLTDVILAFNDVVRGAENYVILYSNKDWTENKLDMARLSQIDLWYAYYHDAPGRACGMWQYSSTGRVNGISGNVDMDIAFKDYPAIIQQRGLNGFALPTMVQVPRGGYITVTITGNVTAGDGAVIKTGRVSNTAIRLYGIGQPGQSTGIYSNGVRQLITEIV